ncbi:proliferating cell nuclear antigen (pcna) [Candidatus Woesearchaeota archaeon]|nr:proliferating cell nuclear antigen (pcna) [Candidatus Woesearchaeota archaeon]
MKLTLAEPKYLKESINVISELVNQARFKVTKDAVEMVAMDPANVAMVIFKLLSSAFVEYDVDKETELAISLDNLKMIMRRVTPKDMVTLEVADAKLKITLKGDSKRVFDIPILEPEDKDQKIPDLTFPVSVSLPSTSMEQAIDDADLVAESVLLAVDANNFVVSAEGDLSKASIEIKKDDNTKITADSKKKVKARYSIEYLKKIIRGSKLADTAVIRFNDDYPLKVEYKVVDKLLLAFILAPRVEND